MQRYMTYLVAVDIGGTSPTLLRSRGRAGDDCEGLLHAA